MAEKFNLARFVEAQRNSYETALAELQRGKKRSHWMWYIFPQIVGLGHSAMAQQYGVKTLGEAKAYLDHPQLGKRLKECCDTLLEIQDRTAHQVFGSPDDMKLKSCMTLFALASGSGNIFEKVLQKYYQGQKDPRTLEILQKLH
ncbi:DUF1810 domain-containing protein [Microbulbifer epialgicus]|uniref:DUF1810 domain-containing protein n=1 Tax=Microbulbifer epialgicus TaxID=393907 RepID=A0ABV4P346_9GAMM